MNPSKDKGNRLERLVVNMAKDEGLEAIRAYASNGLSIGEAEDVDVKIGRYKVQCKSRKAIADYIKPPDSCHFTVVKENRGEPLAVVPLSILLDLMKENLALTQSHLPPHLRTKKIDWIYSIRNKME